MGELVTPAPAPPPAESDGEPSPRGRRDALADVATGVGVFAAAGLAGGLLWAWLTDPVRVTKGPGGVGITEVELGRQFAADGWFVVIGGSAGLVLGGAITAWAMLRRRHLVGTVLVLLLGAAVATVLMRVTGRLAGPGNPEAALAGASVGATAPASLQVHAPVVNLTWPVAAVLGALAVLLSPLRRNA